MLDHDYDGLTGDWAEYAEVAQKFVRARLYAIIPREDAEDQVQRFILAIAEVGRKLNRGPGGGYGRQPTTSSSITGGSGSSGHSSPSTTSRVGTGKGGSCGRPWPPRTATWMPSLTPATGWRTAAPGYWASLRR